MARWTGVEFGYSAAMLSANDVFGSDSPLKKLLPGFQPRAGQTWMAEAIAEAIERRSLLVVEAGTGTGKTFAYLVPALLSGQKTIVSTGTKALQDQLYHRDLPLIGKAIGRPVATALLKGRANYLCLERLEQTTATDRHLRAPLKAVREWRHRTQSGDRAELTEVPEDSPVWPLVTSTAENCLGQKCPFYKECHVVAARRAAQDADLVVVNHHLLLADLAMKEEGFVEFLPGADVVILDEAHQIPDIATQFFGQSVGTRELDRLLEELRNASFAVQQPELERRYDQFLLSLRELRLAAPRDTGRYEMSSLESDLDPKLADVRSALADVIDAVSEFADTSIELEQLHDQLLGASERLAMVSATDSWDRLRWVDVSQRAVRLHVTPLDVANTLSGLYRAGEQSWVFTSATLAINDNFEHFVGRMGLGEAATMSFASPFELETQGLVYVPTDLPLPSNPDHTAAMLDGLTPLLEWTAGGLFCLFTSHRALNAARKWVRSRDDVWAERPTLVQGDAPRDDLLRRFREFGNAVLLGTGSFWEGVDVRGSALTVVAIDKLPFASPGDPLMMARLEHIRREGGNGFADHQLPLAALALKQGAGRLLRDPEDYGVIVLCDPRVVTKSYGKTFLACLRPLPVTREAEQVARFLDRHESARAARPEQVA